MRTTWECQRSRGGFEVSLSWKGGKLEQAAVLSKNGNKCRIRTDRALVLSSEGMKPRTLRPKKGLVEFETKPGRTYELSFRVV